MSDNRQALKTSQQKAAWAGGATGTGSFAPPASEQWAEQQPVAGGACTVAVATAETWARKKHRPMPTVASQGRQKVSEASASQSR